jgi:hypothetical protein
MEKLVGTAGSLDKEITHTVSGDVESIAPHYDNSEDNQRGGSIY